MLSTSQELGRHAPGPRSRAAVVPGGGTKVPYWALQLLVERLAQRVVDLEAALEAATRPPHVQRGADRMGEIQMAVCERLGVAPAALSARGRDAHVAWARHVAMYLARELTDATLPAVGSAFARNHTTVLHACRRVRERIAVDVDAQALVHSLIATLDSDHEPSAPETAQPRRTRGAWRTIRSPRRTAARIARRRRATAPA